MEKKRPHLLITNDDGIRAPGILHLWKSLKDMADISIVAPATEQSGTGLSITTRQPLHIAEIDWPQATAWSVSGTPADCIKLALTVILKNKPDMVVSGINRGSNAGRNVLYSGTVAGAIESVMHDIPAIAFSCSDYTSHEYDLAEPYVGKIVKHFLEHPLPTGTLMNVNFPYKKKGPIRGLKLTRQGKWLLIENPDRREHPVEGHFYYWMGMKGSTYEEHEESDIVWLEKGYVAASPIHIHELTDHKMIQDRKHQFENIFSHG